MDTNKVKFEKASVTVDVLIFTVEERDLKVLLVKRANKPFANSWAIPGGFLLKGESLDEAAFRILIDKTGVTDVYLEQLYTFGDPERDPRGRVATVSYFALIPFKKFAEPSSPKVSEIKWFSIKDIPSLAFDHNKILRYALSRLRGKVGYSNIVYGLLPERFRFSDLQKLYEVVLNKELDKRNFRKRMFNLGLLESTGEKEVSGAHRPAMLYKFKSREVVFFD